MQRTQIARTKGMTSPPQPSGEGQLLQAQIERLEEQFNKLRRQVRQTQQLASLGTAAAMMAHEFNNVMTPLVGYARYALDNDDVELMKKALNMTLQQAAIVASMSERILGLAAHEAASREPVRLRKIVDDAVVCMCRDLSKDGITLQIRMDDYLTVLADAGQLLQVFFNLLLNARQAIEHHSGRIVVSAEPGDDGEIRIQIRDNGCGIPAENLSTIFEPFFSTKTGNSPSPRKGCGLGLALCRDIIEEHGGSVGVESEPGAGTTFTITLPGNRPDKSAERPGSL